MTRRIFRSILVVVLIISSMYIFSGCGKKNDGEDNKIAEISKDIYEAPIRNYMEGLKNKDINLVLQAYPEFMQILTQADIDAVYAQYESIYGANIKLEYSLGEAVRVVEQRDLDILATDIKEAYPEAGDINVTAAFIIPVELTVSGDGIATEGEENKVKEKRDSQDFYVYQRNGENWYVF